MYNRVVKRIIDIFIALLVLIVGAIPMLIIALVVKIDSPGPAIFKQDRLGRGAKVFKFYKFRSMRLNAEHTGSGVYSGKGDPRVTKIGRFLRATSLDELPQFMNVLKGEMSLIGPRPWILQYYTWMTPVQKRRVI